MNENRTALQAMKYYREVIENKQDETLSDEEKKSFLYRFNKYLYELGDGNIYRGLGRHNEIEEKKHEQELRDNPVLAKQEAMIKSENITDRVFIEFILQGGMYLPMDKAKALQNKILQDEIYKSAKQLPASLDVPTNEAATSDAIRQAAINSTSAIAGMEYDGLSVTELKHKAARFDAMRYGKAIAPRTDEAAKDEKQKTRKSKKKIVIQTKPAGRKVDAWNPPAFDILYDGKENSAHRAYDYWCKAQGILCPNDKDKEAFKKAMDREYKRRNR